MKIVTKLLLGYLLLVFLIVLLTFFSIRINQTSLQKEAGRSSVFLAEEMIRRIDYGIYLHIDSLKRFTENPLLKQALISSNGENGEFEQKKSNRCSEFLKTSFLDYYMMNRGYRLFNYAFATNRDGVLTCGAGNIEDSVYSDTTWWQAARKEKLYINEDLFSTDARMAQIETAFSVEDANKGFLGVFTAVISLPALLRETEIIIKRYTTSEVRLVTEEGYLLYESKAHRLMEDISESPILKKAEGDSGYFIIKENNKRKLVSYAVSKGYGSFSGLDWMIILKHDVRDVLADMITLRRVQIVASCIIFALAFSIALIISRSIKKPLAMLHQAAVQVGKGDFSYRIPDPLIRRYENDEIGEFSKTFNRMTAQLEKLYKDLERSNRELDDFSYIISHDLREPLRGIRNYAEIVLEDYSEVLDDEGKELLNTLYRLTNRLDNLIQSLLTYSRAGRFELSFEKTDMNQLGEETIESIRFFLDENNAEVTISDTLPIVTCDRARAGEVFYNLITNAVKYNDKERKKVEIGSENSSSPYVFYVKDNGIGIPEKHRDTVFKIFKRLHSRDKYGGGTGSGLTIVQKLVSRHGGKIWVESTDGEGSIFKFTLEGEEGANNTESNDTDS